MARGRHRTRVNENDERFQQAEEHKDIDNEAEADEEAVFGYSESDNDEGPEEAVTQDDQKFKSVPLFDLDHASGAGGIKTYAYGREESSSLFESDREGAENEDPDLLEDEDDEDKEDIEQFSAWELLQMRRDEIQQELNDEDPWSIPRRWQSSFYITELTNLENKTQDFFIVVRFGHIDRNRRLKGELRQRYFYSNGFTVPQSEAIRLPKPLSVWSSKKFSLAYSDLKNFSITIQLWLLGKWTYNTFHAETEFTLEDLLKDEEPRHSIALERRFTTKQGSKKGEKAKLYTVHKIGISLTLMEIFDFDLAFESWVAFPNKHIPQVGINTVQWLRFDLPMGPKKRFTTTSTPSKTNWFSCPFNYTFTGTQLALENAYVRVVLYAKPDVALAKARVLGTAIISLKSVLILPVVKGVLKVLTTDPDKVVVGNIHGNIRCKKKIWRSHIKGQDLEAVGDFAGGAPQDQLSMLATLNHREMYLVVRFFKCENLPVANKDTNSSDPQLEITWDGIKYTSRVVPNTVRPIFNQNFYFPVRLLDPDSELKVEKYIDTALPVDLTSKGLIKIELWNAGSELASDLLGSCEVDLAQLTGPESVIEERCCGEGLDSGGDTELRGDRPFKYVEEATETAQSAAQEAASRNKPKTLPWYLKKKKTRVWKAQGYPLDSNLLDGTDSKEEATATAFFEVFFLPSLPASVVIPPYKAKRIGDLYWKQESAKWTRDFEMYQRVYMEWFHKALSRRRWLCVSLHGLTRELYPLPAYLTPLAVPEIISAPGDLFHWLGCIGYCASASQIQTQQVGRWNTPSTLLAAKKGTFQDHAVLLASVLLGLGYDAYVCKGTVDRGKMEYVWVMTRDAQSYVTMWDPVLLKRFTLPQRWGIDDRAQPGVETVADDYYDGHYLIDTLNQMAGDSGEREVIYPLQPEAGDEADEDIELPDDRLLTRAELASLLGEQFERRIGGFEKEAEDSGPKVKAKTLMQPESQDLVIRPVLGLLEPTTLAWLPYSSLEVCFNNEQLYGNLQNSDPSLIYFDFESPYQWRPFLNEPNSKCIDGDVIITMPPRAAMCKKLEENITTDLGEMLQSHRNKEGLTFHFERNEEVIGHLEKFVDLMEFRAHLEEEYDPGPPPSYRGWSQMQMEELRVLLYEDQTSEPVATEPWYAQLSRPPEEEDLALGKDERPQMISQPQTQPADFVAFRQFQQTTTHAHPPPEGVSEDDDEDTADSNRQITRLLTHKAWTLAQPLDLELDSDAPSSPPPKHVPRVGRPSMSKMCEPDLDTALKEAHLEEEVNCWKRPDGFRIKSRRPTIPSHGVGINIRGSATQRDTTHSLQNTQESLSHEDTLINRDDVRDTHTESKHSMLNPIEDYDEWEEEALTPDVIQPYPTGQEDIGGVGGMDDRADATQQVYETVADLEPEATPEMDEAALAAQEEDFMAQLAAYYGQRPRYPYLHQNPGNDHDEKKYKIKQIKQWDKYYKMVCGRCNV